MIWPFVGKKKEGLRLDLGTTTVVADLDNGHNGREITITRSGYFLLDDRSWHVDSDGVMKIALGRKWIRADDDVFYNTQFIRSYTSVRKENFETE